MRGEGGWWVTQEYSDNHRQHMNQCQDDDTTLATQVTSYARVSRACARWG